MKNKTGEAETALTVQAAAAQTGLSVHTLRYYERAGLIPSIRRDDGSGHRRYQDRDLTFIEFLKRLRTTGMPISEMQRYADLMRQGNITMEERKAMLEAHRERVRLQIAELQASLSAIEWKIENYDRLGLEQAVSTSEKEGTNGIK
ncbi:MAG: MerR family transcriptional regulator [Cytophagales bacterium]|nr:MerR family transcriptional regulator [Armatimonadota bacterium]